MDRRRRRLALAQTAIAAPAAGRAECGPAPVGASPALAAVISACNLDQEVTRLIVSEAVRPEPGCEAWPGVGFSLVAAARLEAAAYAAEVGAAALAEEAALHGDSALRAVWLTALHADNTPEVRAAYVTGFSQLAQRGVLDVDRYMQIADRHELRISGGETQIYGSAWRCEAGEARLVAPLENPEGADRLRMRLGAPGVSAVLRNASRQCE